MSQGRHSFITTRYKEGHIHSNMNGQDQEWHASCCAVNARNLSSRRAAKLWITRTWRQLQETEGFTNEKVIF